MSADEVSNEKIREMVRRVIAVATEADVPSPSRVFSQLDDSDDSAPPFPA